MGGNRGPGLVYERFAGSFDGYQRLNAGLWIRHEALRRAGHGRAGPAPLAAPLPPVLLQGLRAVLQTGRAARRRPTVSRLLRTTTVRLGAGGAGSSTGRRLSQPSFRAPSPIDHSAWY